MQEKEEENKKEEEEDEEENNSKNKNNNKKQQQQQQQGRIINLLQSKCLLWISPVQSKLILHKVFNIHSSVAANR
jgi:ABC-type Zn2+ transport system substrate-binding protein/surface adhesin